MSETSTNYVEEAQRLIDEYGLMTLEDALVACFGEIVSGDGVTEGYKVECCGEISYGSGIVGSDIARCKGCGREIRNVLSPHVSPLLLNIEKSTTAVFSLEITLALGNKIWMVMPAPEEMK